MTEQKLTNGQKTTDKGFKSGWNKAEKIAIANFMFPMMEAQKAFGKVFDTKLAMQWFDMKLSNRFSAEQVLFALDIYTDRGDDMPSTANIIAILHPDPPKITDTAYIAAKRKYEINGFNKFSDEKDIIDAYEKQGKDNLQNHKIHCDKIKAIAGNTFKQIGN